MIQTICLKTPVNLLIESQIKVKKKMNAISFIQLHTSALKRAILFSDFY